MLQCHSFFSFLLFLTLTTIVSSFTTDFDLLDEQFVFPQQSNENNLKISESRNFTKRAAAACNCGENSYSCKLDKGKKICKCKPSFAVGEFGLCVKACNETRVCKNGGSCIQHVCVCLPGTSGPFCATIEDCERNRLCDVDDYTSCEYNVERQKAVCHCHVGEYRFDEATRKCRNCLCTEVFRQNPEAYSYCEYQQGKKTCTCREHHAYNPRYDYCSPCYCGENSRYCEFNLNGDKICTCKDDYYLLYRGSTTCERCSCGKHGMCENSYYCACDEGYEVYNKTCVECSCGKYGKCKFDVNGKQKKCDCLPGFADKSGKCEMCYCGESSNCTFNGNQKVCECPTGYENVNGLCADVNECKKHNPCDATQKCLNTLGSYKCVCSKGYTTEIMYYSDDDDQPTEICKDINECKDPQACLQPNTKCENTLGSYVCICKSGFISRGGTETNTFCDETADWSIYTVVLATSIVAVIGGLGILHCAKRNLQDRQVHSDYELT